MSEVPAFSLVTAHDIYLVNQGSHFRRYDKLGARVVTVGGASGSYFAVWAPKDEAVSLASVLYLECGGKNGEWIPNHHGGRENLEVIELLRSLNHVTYENSGCAT